MPSRSLVILKLATERKVDAEERPAATTPVSTSIPMILGIYSMQQTIIISSEGEMPG